jgi:AcrR family transcriptional regulator
LARDRKNTQRERILGAIAEVVARDGYEAASIAQVIGAAGVSRRTFYEHFRDIEDGFLTALLGVQERLRADAQQALSATPPQRAWRATLETLFELAAARPADARILTNDSLTAGPQSLELRDRGLAQLARSIEASYARLPAQTSVPDISPAMLLGGVYRLLAARARRGQANLPKLLAELVAWITTYEQPLDSHRWRALEPLALPRPGPPAAPLLPPHAAQRPEGRLAEPQSPASHRQRILFSIAELAAERGYRATTLADVQQHAGIDADEFRRVFADKQEAFAAVHEERIQHVTSVTAGAFFAAGAWPERIWEAARVFADVLEQNPAPAHIAFVEVHAAGPRAVRRNDELVLAFTLFLQQGYEYQAQAPALAGTPVQAPSQVQPPPDPPSRLALEAIAATIFEIVYRQLRGARNPRFAGLVAHVTFLCIAPFVGAVEANRLIDEQLRSNQLVDEQLR